MSDDFAAQADHVDASVRELIGAVDQLNSTMRHQRSLLKFAIGGLLLDIVWTILGSLGLWWIKSTADDVETERREQAEIACEAANESRDVIRRMARDAPLEVGEALIEAVANIPGRPPPDPAVVEQFRDAMARRLDGIVNQLPARRWDEDAEACVDVPLATGD